jgi:CheY-like chemotaxis protein
VKNTTPLDPSQLAAGHLREERSPESKESYLVLVVDDSIDNLTVISLYLQQCGYRVAAATNGEEAVKVAGLVKPDIIVMDLAMPGVDGLESTRQIRLIENLKDIPVIALTAFSTEGFRRAAHDTGFDGYLTKPVDFSRLTDLIGRLIGLARSARTQGHGAAPHN